MEMKGLFNHSALIRKSVGPFLVIFSVNNTFMILHLNNIYNFNRTFYLLDPNVKYVLLLTKALQ